MYFPRGTANSLNALRRRRGPNACRSEFHKLRASRRAYAAGLVNDPNLSFATCFALLPELRGWQPEGELCPRVRTSVRLCEIIRTDKSADGNAVHPRYDEATRDALRWMFASGEEADGMDADFDRTVDISACVLLKIYHEEEILPGVVRLMFRRNRRGSCLHDLAWAFFQSAGPRALRSVAERLLSPSAKDAELARLLLHLPQAGNSRREKRAQYARYLDWLEENRPYLSPTDEGLCATSSPHACAVNLSAKYLNRKPRAGGPEDAPPLTESEKGCLACFSAAQPEERELLAHFSCKLHEKDPLRWSEWIRRPLEKQIRAARGGEADR